MKNKVNKGIISIISILAVFVVLAAFGGAYYFLKNKPDSGVISQSNTTLPNTDSSPKFNAITEWSLEAHDSNNVRIRLCQVNSKSCQDSLKMAQELNAGSKIMADISKRNGDTYLLNNQGAYEYCDNLSENGHDDWRLPTAEELVNANKVFTASVDKAKVANYSYIPSQNKDIDTFHFSEYWSSSKDSKSTNVKSVSFGINDGVVRTDSSSNQRLVRCGR